MNSHAPELVMPEIDWGYDLVEDMAERLVSLEENGNRCVPIRYKGGVAWLVVGYDTASNVFRDEAQIPASHFFKTYMDTVGFSLFHLEGAEHKAYKTALLSRLSPAAVHRMTNKHLVPVADQIIDEFGDAREIEFLESYGRRYAFNVMSRLLGVKVARADEMRILGMVGELSQIQDPYDTKEHLRERALVAKAGTNEVLRPVVEARRKEPLDDLISFFISLDVNGRKLNDEEVLDFARSVYEGGSDSTGLQLGNILNVILSRPGMKDTLLDDPDQRVAAIDELMRLEPLVGLTTRLTMKETVIAGVLVPAESLVLLGVPGANRDKSQFHDPNQFSLDRNARTALSFGMGVRMCPGQHLARQGLAVSLDRLLGRLPGLRLAGAPGRQGGTMARYLQKGLIVRFNDILPAERVAARV